MIRVIRRMNMYVYILLVVFSWYTGPGPWYMYVPDNSFPSTGTDKTRSPGICMGATAGFWFKKTTRELRIGAPPGMLRIQPTPSSLL